MVVAATLIPASASADDATFVDGNKLYDQCTGTAPGSSSYYSGYGLCAAYINGIADALGSGSSIRGWSTCFPERVTIAQMVDVVKQSLAAHPETRHLPAARLVVEALARTFPCKQ